MTERELEARLIHEQIPLPNGFDARQEAALCRAMAQTRGVAHRPKRTLLLAAALMLLTGAAFAAGGRGLAFFWRQASPEAERLIERGIAQSGGRLDAAEFVVREAVFDGSTLQAVVVVRAENGRARRDAGAKRQREPRCGARGYWRNGRCGMGGG